MAVSTGGKAVKWTAPAPTALGDTATGAEIAAYVAAYVTGMEKAVGRCIGDPAGGVVTIELRNLGGIQNG